MCETHGMACEIYMITCEIYMITCEIYVISCYPLPLPQYDNAWPPNNEHAECPLII